MIKRSIIALSVLVLLLAACAPAISKNAPSFAVPMPAEEAQPQMGAGGSDSVAPMAPPAPAGGNTSSQQVQAYDSSGNAYSVPERLVIQNVDMEIVVDQPAQAMSTVAQLANELGGFVVTSNISKVRTSDGIEVPQATITVRVPAEKLDDALGKIRALTKNPEEDVRYENRSGQDVTKEYVDQKSRLANLEDTEKQLREIMASANKTEDVMSVFNQLAQVREQIEMTKGQIKFFEESAALSAIKLQILSQEAIAPLSIGGWKPAGVARDALQATINAYKFLANVVIWAVVFLIPIGLAIGLPIWLVVFIVRRLRQNRKVAPAPPPTQ